MTGRIPFGSLTLLAVLVCAPIQAQEWNGPPPAYGMQPAGFQAIQGGAGQYNAPYTYQQGPVGPQIPGSAPRKIFEELPDDLGFTDGDTPLGRALTNTFRHSWFRGEYLLWNISGPGNVLLGEQTSTGVPNSTSAGGNGSNTGLINISTTANRALNIDGGPANVSITQGLIYARTVNGVSGLSQTPSINNFSIENMNGFRGTYGLPVAAGEIEVSGFVLGSSSSSYDASNLIQPAITANPAAQIGSSLGANGLPAVNQQTALFISQALLVNGVPQGYSSTSSAFIDYDVSYHAQLTTSVWGTEGNYVMDTPDPNSPFQFKPTFGFRYLNFRDRLDQGGQYNQANPTNPAVSTVVSREIDTSANNNMYGPQAGMRFEYTQQQFRVGFEPKLMMGLNTWQSNLNTSNVLSSTDPSQSILQRGTTFSPIVDLKAYGNIALSKYVSAYASYNFLFVGNVNRSYNDTIYNETAAGQSNFLLNKTYSNATMQGISVGFDIRY